MEKLRTEAVRLLEEMKQVRLATEEHLTFVANARKAADEHATYAFQAKVNTESHASAVSAIKGQADSDASSLAAAKRSYDEIIAAATIAKATLDADARSAGERRREAEQSLELMQIAMQTARTKAEQVDAAKVAADELLAELHRSRDEASAALAKSEQARAEAESANSRAGHQAVAAEELVRQITSAKARGVGEANEVRAARDAAKADQEALAAVIKHLEASDNIATNHEKRVAELAAKLAELNVTAEKLLPGATSAGLASSFLVQKERFAGPQKRWLWTFLVCIGLLVVVAMPSYWSAVWGTSGATWDTILIGMAMRLPVVIPLVWLAIYAGRNYMLAARLEEDYAFKEAISMAFEGYKREMDKIGAGDASNPTPLTKLCLNVLTALAERPGRIYESHQKDFTPGNEARDAIQGGGTALKDRTIAP